MNSIESEVISKAAAELSSAKHGEKSAIVERAARLLMLSNARTYALIAQYTRSIGKAPSRRRRSDANTSSVSDAELQLIGGVYFEDFRNGKAMLPLAGVIEMLFAGGKLTKRHDASHIARLLRARHMHPEQLARPRPTAGLRSEYPNELWQMDASQCVLARAPKGLQVIDKDVFQHKTHKVTKIVYDLLTRYVLTDHASGCVATQYYVGPESMESALKFMTWAMVQRKDANGRGLPFHGVPRYLYTDQGSAFKGAAFVNFCSGIGIELIHHKPRNARATGQVENAQNLVERNMEGLLRMLPKETLSVDALNALAEKWMDSFNGNRKHSRHGMTRYGAWLKITEDQLRAIDDPEMLLELPASAPKRCRVDDRMHVRFKVKGQSRAYDVSHIEGVCNGGSVYVYGNPLKYPQIRVGLLNEVKGGIDWHEAEPVRVNDYGWDQSSPRVGESYRAMRATRADERRNEISRAAYGVPSLEEADKRRRDKHAIYLGEIDPLAALSAPTPAYLIATRGTAHRVPLRVVAPIVKDVVAICLWLKRDGIGLRPRLPGQREEDLSLDPRVFPWLQEHYPGGVPESEYASIKERVSALVAQVVADDLMQAAGGAK